MEALGLAGPSHAAPVQPLWGAVSGRVCKQAGGWVGCRYSGTVSRPCHCARGRMRGFFECEVDRRWHSWQRAAGRDQMSVRDVS